MKLHYPKQGEVKKRVQQGWLDEMSLRGDVDTTKVKGMV